ncbi:MAG: 3-oxoacyl-[acyl-carrier protein] reductase [Gammaproteobacteria bacterium]|jgi:3-oxoacyl-[acyl-carrier protein] reductase
MTTDFGAGTDARRGSGALAGQVALLTGAVRRNGRAMALAMAGEGANIVINARSSRDEALAVVREVETLGGEAMAHLADIRDEAAVSEMFAAVDERFGRLDILVNNAANRRQTPFLEMSFDEWKEFTTIVLDGAFLCSREALKRMVAQGGGRIVNIGGVSAAMGTPNRAHVVAAKGGLLALTRALATEFAPHGITVNCVAPGLIGGDRPASAGSLPPGAASNVLLGREGTFEEVASMVMTLVLPTGGYITGQTIHVNGGMYFG